MPETLLILGMAALVWVVLLYNRLVRAATWSDIERVLAPGYCQVP
jgi:hypothetical protein